MMIPSTVLNLQRLWEKRENMKSKRALLLLVLKSMSFYIYTLFKIPILQIAKMSYLYLFCFILGQLCFGLDPKIKFGPYVNCIIDEDDIKCEKTNIPFKTIFYHFDKFFLSYFF